MTAAVAEPKAAIMIIGDEVLSGSIVDTNTPWLVKKLFSRGVDLVRVEMVRLYPMDSLQKLSSLSFKNNTLL